MSGSRKHPQLHKLGDAHGWRCQHCNRRVHCRVCEPLKPVVSHATRDHLVPQSWGGRGGDNIVLACWHCNHRKGDRKDTAPKPAKMPAIGKCVAEIQQRRVRRSGRIRYATREAAEAMCREIERKWERPVAAYSCKRCGEWHIGKSDLVAVGATSGPVGEPLKPTEQEQR